MLFVLHFANIGRKKAGFGIPNPAKYHKEIESD